MTTFKKGDRIRSASGGLNTTVFTVVVGEPDTHNLIVVTVDGVYEFYHPVGFELAPPVFYGNMHGCPGQPGDSSTIYWYSSEESANAYACNDPRTRRVRWVDGKMILDP